MGKRSDIKGQRFGRLTAVRPIFDGRRIKWFCRCKCGGSTITFVTALRLGRSQSCGCLKKERALESKLVDIKGQKFGRLTAVRSLGLDKHHKSRWLCRCECGGTTITGVTSLRKGATQSCGCYQKERASEANKKHIPTLSKEKLHLSIDRGAQ